MSRGYARTFGQDLMKGEHVVGGGQHVKDENRLTWVAGDRSEETLDEVSRKILAAQPHSGTSIFDPVLCELAYRWFSPPGGTVLDPFAGGSVRGIVAAALGRHYVGCDLHPEQIAANEQQWRDVSPRLNVGSPPPRWICDTIAAFEAAGARHYNEAILVTACGSLPIRAGRAFDGGRKLGKTHQNVLVFCKGDWKKATEAVGPVEFGEIPQADGEAPPADDPAAAFGEVL